MVKHSKSLAASQPVMSRPGEGQPVSVVTKTAFDKDGKAVQIMKANMITAPVPDRKYACHVASVVDKRGDAHLMFGQEKIASDDLRSLVVVSMGPFAIESFLESLKRLDSGSSIDDLAEQVHISSEPLTKIKEEPTSTIGFRANQIVVSIANDEACLDFYQVSASALRVSSANQTVAVEPIVRVEMKFALFLSVVAELRQILSRLPKLKPIVFQEAAT